MSTIDMALLAVPRNAGDVGEFIYCSSSDRPLQREYAVPYGLNGTWTLLRASCAECAAVTHCFERDTLKGLWPAIRSVLSMQSRRKSRLATLPLVIEVGGSEKTIEVARVQFPLYLPTPIFPRPGYVTGLASAGASTAQLRFRHVGGPSFQEISHKHSADFVGARLTFAPEEFARTLAKIAFLPRHG
jgi:hypothetical protein